MNRINSLEVSPCSLLPSAGFLWSEENGKEREYVKRLGCFSDKSAINFVLKVVF